MKLQKGHFDWCLSVYIFIWLYISFDILDNLGIFDDLSKPLLGSSSWIYEIKPVITEILECC